VPRPADPSATGERRLGEIAVGHDQHVSGTRPLQRRGERAADRVQRATERLTQSLRPKDRAIVAPFNAVIAVARSEYDGARPDPELVVTCAVDVSDKPVMNSPVRQSARNQRKNPGTK